jgi:hypothetical protein
LKTSLINAKKISRGLFLCCFLTFGAISDEDKALPPDSIDTGLKYVRFPQPVWVDSIKLLSGPFIGADTPAVEAAVLENGTEITRLDSAQASEYMAFEKLNYRGIKRKRTAATPKLPPFWKTLDWNLSQVFKWTTWPSGFRVKTGQTIMDFYSDPGSLFRRPWTHKVFQYYTEVNYNTGTKWFTAGFGLIFNNLWGRLVDSLENRHEDIFHKFGYSLTLGGPGLRYELRTAAWTVPEFAYLEKRLPKIANRKAYSDLLYQYYKRNLKAGFRRNKSHRFAARFGVLRYDMVIDSDVYNGLVHHLRLREMKAKFGAWGTGFTAMRGVLIPGFYITLFPVEMPAIPVAGQRFVFSLQPINAEFHFHNKSNFLVALNLTCRLNDPLHKLYGVFNLE